MAAVSGKMILYALKEQLYETFGIDADGGKQVVWLGSARAKIGDGFSQCEGAVKLHIYKGRLPGDQFWQEGRGQAERIVHMKGRNTILRAVDIEVKGKHVLHSSNYGASIVGQ